MAHLHEGDCRAVLPTLAAGSVDSVVTDPPYPCIKRPYGYWTESPWFELMDVVVPECRRVLKPTRSAVFILQPNSERLGKMRLWLWEFVLKWGKEWGLVQDAYWWSVNAIPEAHSIQGKLMRPSVKWCVWLGTPHCYRNQLAVKWTESDENRKRRMTARAGRESHPSGHGMDRVRSTASGESGVTPYNVLPFACVGEEQSKSGGKHTAMTPLALTRWWVRYLTPPGGIVLDPFAGSGTTLLAAQQEGMRAVGIEQDAKHCDIIRARLATAGASNDLFAEAV